MNRAFHTYIHTLMNIQAHMHTHTDTHRYIQTYSTTSLTHPSQENAGLPFPPFSLFTAHHCVLLSRAQQSLMCTDTSNSGHMVHDK